MSGYFDRKGQPMTMEEWSRAYSDMEYKRVALTKLPDGKEVSTVWLGLDHSFGGALPLFFETMVFPGDGTGRDLDAARYSSEEEARVGHAAMVERWSHPQPTQPGGDA